VCTLERIPYIFLCNDAIDIYIILTESHDQGLSNKPIYILRNPLVNEIHVEQSKCPKHLKHFWGHCIANNWSESESDVTILQPMTDTGWLMSVCFFSVFMARGVICETALSQANKRGRGPHL